MIRYLALLGAVVLASAEKPRVQFFAEGQLETRAQALDYCQGMNMHIAHESQLLLDLEEGFAAGHHKCGWSWARGDPVHAHCEEHLDKDTCKPGASVLKQDNCHNLNAFGVYCRVMGDDDDRPRFKLPAGELVDVFLVEGPQGPQSIQSMSEARRVCENEGNKLAYWVHLQAYIERYNIQICHFGWLRHNRALFNANCENDGKVNWKPYDGKGYDAICIGREPYPYQNPCTNSFKFKNLEGVPIYCDDDNSIIIQERPLCSEEEFSFDQDWHVYEIGFGKVGKGYWLGLGALSKLTNMWNFRLRLEIEDEDGNAYNAEYSQFKVGPEEDNYPLHVSGYSGNAGDMFNAIQSNLQTSNGAPFSSYNHDHDGVDEYNCGVEYKSGWWFQACHVDNLNGLCPGQYGYGPSIAATRTWRSVSNNSKGLRRVKMTIKYVSTDDDNIKNY